MDRKIISEKLNVLLADCEIFYANLRGFHWNIVGDKFFELHELYEEYYNEINALNDSIAERILQIDGTPINSYSKYLEITTLKEVEGESDWEKGLKNVLATFEHLCKEILEIATLAKEQGDKATESMLYHTLSNFEKKCWMIKAYFK